MINKGRGSYKELIESNDMGMGVFIIIKENAILKGNKLNIQTEAGLLFQIWRPTYAWVQLVKNLNIFSLNPLSQNIVKTVPPKILISQGYP